MATNQGHRRRLVGALAEIEVGFAKGVRDIGLDLTDEQVSLLLSTVVGDNVAKARRELGKDIAAAWNTYETVRVSGEFVELVKSSRKLLDGLLNRQVPTLRPFQNIQMKQEFEKLTEQLRIQRGT